MNRPVRAAYVFFIAVTFLFTVMDVLAVTGPGIAWPYCRRITLSPVTPAANFQVKVTLASGQYTHMNATDGRDLRFYDAANNLCNYWIETWNTSGNSTIWVKVVTSGTTYLYLYYGNSSATAVSSGSATFDFFDDFPGTSLAGNWTTATVNGTVVVASGVVTLTTTGASSTAGIYSAYTPSSSSYWLETKHKEGTYCRNRFYATTVLSGGSPTGFDIGYFTSTMTNQATGNVFWNGFQASTLTAGVDYLTAWQLIDGSGASNYNFYTYNYSTGAQVDVRTASNIPNCRYISISVTEVSGTSTIVDWVRVRKFAASVPVASIGSEVNNISASISGQTNVNCYRNATGSATTSVSGGSGSYTYSWNTTPAQTTANASGLPAGTYTVSVTETGIGLQASTQVVITEKNAVTASASGQNPTCFGNSNGEITVTAGGGTGPYYFSKDNGSNWTGSTYPSQYTFTGLDAITTYRIRAKDGNGCMSPAIP
jgi:large repetitive protein